MALQSSKLYNRVINANFLELSPNPDGLYDRVGMNPPFDRERDIDHVVHALKFLKPGGILCAVMSAATEFRETRKSRAFRAMIKQLDGRFETLPERSFSSVGTNVNTVLLVIRTKNT
jgi:16S rRNA G1207 methylase RsmC